MRIAVVNNMVFSYIKCWLLGHIFISDDYASVIEVRCNRCNVLLSEPQKDKNVVCVNIKEMPKSYINGCMGKRRFESNALAVERMGRMKKRPITLHAYFCEHCLGWHLGNSKVKHRRSYRY